MELQATQSCACCQYQLEPATTYCDHCGYPLQGSKEEQDQHIANRSLKEIDLSQLEQKVQTAGNSLYWIAGILTVSSIFTYFTLENDEDIVAIMITSVILIAAFLSLAIWSKTKPAAALIAGLSLYVIIVAINAVAEPATLFSGIIFKILIIAYLIKGILAVLEADKLKKELNIK